MKAKPDWLKIRVKQGDNYLTIKNNMRNHSLHTVCEEANCPNIYECWENRTATFMILGKTCTRACRFCAVDTGRPLPRDPEEAEHVAEVAESMGIQYVVITSVARDDLPDGGASGFVETIQAIRRRIPLCRIEVLIPDFNGDIRSLQSVLDAKPDVLNHNIETVRRLTGRIRSKATYERTLALLKNSKGLYPRIPTKSSLMIGVGETYEELLETMDDLRKVNVDILTIGQYLQPGPTYVNVEKYYHPDEFEKLKEEGRKRGFTSVQSGPLVRSSYRAHEQKTDPGSQ
ncbi:MAG TPA: lipoyl synthase [Paenibacillaceae bacterium]|nr:lipoyl synthase [Paenibacillaceae bacterium]